MRSRETVVELELLGGEHEEKEVSVKISALDGSNVDFPWALATTMHCAHTLAETICSLLGNDVFWQFTALSTAPFRPPFTSVECSVHTTQARAVSIACNLHFKMYCQHDKNKFHLGFYLTRYAYSLVRLSTCSQQISPVFMVYPYF